MPARLMHVDLDAFFVEVCRQRNPELRASTCSWSGGRRESRSVVQSASYGARKFGVARGDADLRVRWRSARAPLSSRASSPGTATRRARCAASSIASHPPW
jgi:nucleotidyltransferase/DNA polymerase involved in DNA repair